MTLKITQAAREAAADRLRPVRAGDPIAATKIRILAGELDSHGWVQAFQRAMNQAADEALERAAPELLGVLEKTRLLVAACAPSGFTDEAACMALYENNAVLTAAIRALKGQQP
jgi:hypothetical protein